LGRPLLKCNRSYYISEFEANLEKLIVLVAIQKKTAGNCEAEILSFFI